MGSEMCIRDSRSRRAIRTNDGEHIIWNIHNFQISIHVIDSIVNYLGGDIETSFHTPESFTVTVLGDFNFQMDSSHASRQVGHWTSTANLTKTHEWYYDFLELHSLFTTNTVRPQQNEWDFVLPNVPHTFNKNA